ncbi:MAG: hypothetical protein ABIQ16_27375 [Polyangiaceae bacterium]
MKSLKLRMRVGSSRRGQMLGALFVAWACAACSAPKRDLGAPNGGGASPTDAGDAGAGLGGGSSPGELPAS